MYTDGQHVHKLRFKNAFYKFELKQVISLRLSDIMIIGKLFKKIEKHLKFMKCINIYMKIHLSIKCFCTHISGKIYKALNLQR